MPPFPVLPYVKGHGTANDFVLLPDPDGLLELTPALVRALCDRRRGIGGDGVLRVVRTAAVPGLPAALAEAPAPWFMDYRNADGSIAEMCGNGVRVYARYLVAAGHAGPGRLRLATRGGVKDVDVPAAGDVTVDMGPGEPGAEPVQVRVGARAWPATAVSMGNPHAVVFVDDLAEAGPLREAPEVLPAAAFPDGVNVEFAVEAGERALAMRVHERGVGETQSCGTGACAAVVAAMRRSGVPAPAVYAVDVPGGRLTVTVRADGHVLLAGPAVLVGDGVLREEWLAAARTGDLTTERTA